MLIKIVDDNYISFNYRKLGNVDKECWYKLRETYTRSNPTYYRNKNMGFSVAKIEPTIKSYFLKDNRVYFFRGLKFPIKKILEQHGHEVKFLNRRLSFPPESYNSKIKLRPEQQEALDILLRKKQGILIAPPSFGKTVVLLQAIAKTQQPAGVIVWDVNHQQQWISEATNSKLLNLPESSIGGVGGVFLKPKVGALNLMMQQSLANPKHREVFKESLGIICADECQRYGSRTFQEVIHDFPAKYRFGVSANKKRSDGKEFLIYDSFGRIVHEAFDGEIGSRKKAKIYLVPSEYYNEDYLEDNNEIIMLNDMARDRERNELIIDRAQRKLARKKFVLILVKRKYQALYLWDRLTKCKYRVELLLGKTTDRDKVAKDWEPRWRDRISKYDEDKAFQRIKKLGLKKKLDVVIATGKGDVGISVKTFDHVIITTPIGRDLENFNQQKGRVERDYDADLEKKYGPKPTPTCDYIWDIRMKKTRKKGEKIRRTYGGVSTVNDTKQQELI